MQIVIVRCHVIQVSASLEQTRGQTDAGAIGAVGNPTRTLLMLLRSVWSLTVDQLKEVAVETVVLGQFRVEGRSKYPSLQHGYWGARFASFM